MNPLLLVVEDEAAIRELLAVSLGAAGYRVVCVADADAAQAALSREMPALMLLDWMLPGRSGLAFAKALRASALTRDLPIIMVTARSDEADRVAGLEAWVDDYVTKPFSPRELRARVQAVLRRRLPEATQEPLRAGSVVLDPARHELTISGQRVPIAPTEFRLLRFLLARPDRVYTRAQLLDHVWGSAAVLEERTVDVHVRRLRAVLEPYGQEGLIETVRGSGYRLVQVPDPAPPPRAA